MSVKFLSNDHFSDAGGRALRCNIPGITFVMFVTDNCPNCKAAMPVFYKLSNVQMRVTWAIANVGTYRQLIAMAKNTNTPIRAVPMLILYVNGRPHANYKGDNRSEDEINNFLNKVLSSIDQNPQKFNANNNVQQNPYPQQQQTYQPQQQQDVAMQGESMNMPNNVTPHNAPYLNVLKKMSAGYQ